ncbi:type VI secretion system tip protein VgrG [Pseudoalteromonas shioyasakiensis]|uniref:Type VI secretion system tip protein VgrG n=3 Tax=Pseudoalteromonas TaxID=53246 RepID=A0ABT6TYH7_9GAMM|nr:MULTISPECIES: type VI secretion system tip protein VgrG [Pseudoalteromonas]MDI4668970.1 type VI secretion system tip protein VgrG [Pseudoalteromonas shioyasakiensis]MDI4674095.1 type VI secretion system tip protein VgrG [Pseudoalteromonas shioyasakiensis]MDI4685356.1 type VI secretion system tip protein VgrG [Pseudoalteromonas shioyasakiensis]MDI4704172.1 type VI secretion system tip protein VgrG [Pseudoalteromonas shioyasakiensis]
MGFMDSLNELKANTSHFSVSVQGLPDGMVSVTDFESSNDSLCEDFAFSIQVLSQEHLSAEMLLGKDAKLNLVWSMSDRTISGIISAFTAHGQSHQGYHYTLTMSSYLTLLKHQHSNRVFTMMDPAAIVKSVFTKAGFPMQKFSIQASGPTLEMTVQYNETDYEFVTRLMRKYGFVYGFVEQTGGDCTFKVCNSSKDFSSLCDDVSLSYVPPSGQVRNSETIFAISRKAQLHPQSVSLNDYNYKAQGNLNVSTANNTSYPGFGDDSHYADNFPNANIGNSLAKVRQQAFDCQREQLIIDTDCRALRPGMLLTVYDHPDHKGLYLITRVDHKGSQSAAVEYGSQVKGLTYKNQAYLLPASVEFRAELSPARRVFATFNATIEQEVDDDGNYLVRLPFNQDGEGQESRPTRLLQQYGGSGHGMHFPLTTGTEVLVTGENGDLDRPIILGALYNQSCPNPVTSQNPTENKLVTRAGHSLIMDDKSGEEKISLANKENKNQLLLDATENAHQATLKSVEGDVKISAKENLQFVAENDAIFTAANDFTNRVENTLQVQTREGDIKVTAAADLTLKSDADTRIEATDGSSELKAAQELNLQSEQDFSVYSVDGNLEFQAPNGDLNLSSGANITIKGEGRGSIQLSQGGASVEIDAAGNLTIDATNITLSARNIAIKGNAISNN